MWERHHSTMVHTEEVFSHDLFTLLKTKNAILDFPHRINPIAEIKDTFHRGE